jgi:hypothetical protein
MKESFVAANRTIYRASRWDLGRGRGGGAAIMYPLDFQLHFNHDARGVTLLVFRLGSDPVILDVYH